MFPKCYDCYCYYHYYCIYDYFQTTFFAVLFQFLAVMLFKLVFGVWKSFSGHLAPTYCVHSWGIPKVQHVFLLTSCISLIIFKSNKADKKTQASNQLMVRKICRGFQNKCSCMVAFMTINHPVSYGLLSSFRSCFFPVEICGKLHVSVARGTHIPYSHIRG